MKQLITAMVPAPILDWIRKTRDWLGLAASPRQSLDSENLRAADTLVLGDIFANRDITFAWEQDSKVIRDVYGEEDKMGGVNPGDRRALYYLILALEPKKVLEVGTHIGASTLHIARALKRLNQGGRVTTVDIMDVNHSVQGAWKQLGLPKPPREYAQQLECLDQIDFKRGASLQLMHTTNERYDFVFLDGDHSARAVYQEVGAALSLLNPEGVILLHDYYRGGKSLYSGSVTIWGPFHALERLRKEEPAVNIVPLGHLPWPTKQNTCFTTLALLVHSAWPKSVSHQGTDVMRA
jgi:predicted O-methyltransferase YrrM